MMKSKQWSSEGSHLSIDELEINVYSPQKLPLLISLVMMVEVFPLMNYPISDLALKPSSHIVHIAHLGCGLNDVGPSV